MCACKDPSTKLTAIIFQHLRGFPALITTFQPVFKILHADDNQTAPGLRDETPRSYAPAERETGRGSPRHPRSRWEQRHRPSGHAASRGIISPRDGVEKNQLLVPIPQGIPLPASPSHCCRQNPHGMGG